jgi:hypothetical protein
MNRFEGPFDRLQELVATAGETGEWVEIEHGHQFRATSGAMLN